MSNPIEAYYKLMDSLDYQISLGGWHKISVIAGFGLLIYAIAISVMYFDKKSNKD